jgi:hypothetical protein
MGGRDHSCEGCGNGGFSNDYPCTCPVTAEEGWVDLPTHEQAVEAAREAGVQAERERIEAGLDKARENTDHAHDKDCCDFGYVAGLDAALAVVTGKEGASDEGR